MDNSGYEHDLHMQTQANNNKAAEANQYSPEEVKAEKRIIYKNVLSVSFLLLFVAFESMSKLQSSINVVSPIFIFTMSRVTL